MAAGRLSLALDRRAWFGPALVVPAAALLGLLLAYPLGLGVWLGFEDAKIGAPGTFIGVENYQYLLDDPVFRLTAINTALGIRSRQIWRTPLPIVRRMSSRAPRAAKRDRVGKRIVAIEIENRPWGSW